MTLLNETFDIFFTKKNKNLTKYFIIKAVTIYNNNKNNRKQKYLVFCIFMIFPKTVYIKKYCIKYNTIIKIIVILCFVYISF